MAQKSKGDSLSPLQEKLKSENLCGLYLFTGEETFNKDFYISKFKTAFENNPMAEFNVLTFDGKETPSDTILGAIESYPVMADNKLVIIKNSGIFKSVSEKDKELWTELFKNPPDYAVVIFDEAELDGRSALLKKFKETGIFAEFEYLDNTTMSSWIKGFLTKRGYGIQPDATNELMSRAGASMGNVHNEMNKLMDFCGEGATITKADVETVVAKSLQDKVFDMLDAILTGNRNVAFSILSDLKLLREEPAKIVPLLGNSVSGMLKTKLLQKEGCQNIASVLGVAPFIVKKYTDQSRNVSETRLKNMLSLCLAGDKAIKYEGKDKWIVLETLMIELSAK